jgi:hypothetical protein
MNFIISKSLVASQVSSLVSLKAVWEAVSHSSICHFGITKSLAHFELIHSSSKISTLPLFFL